MRSTHLRILVVGLAGSAIACGSWFFDLSGTRCDSDGACGARYSCVKGTCQKTASSAAAPDAGLQVGVSCTSPRDCASKACALGSCRTAVFLDDFENESNGPDGGLFTNWDSRQDCSSYGAECQTVIAEITTNESYVFEGSHAALLGIDDDCSASPYWSYLVKRMASSTPTAVLGMYVKWLGGQLDPHATAHVAGLWWQAPHPGASLSSVTASIRDDGVGSRSWAIDVFDGSWNDHSIASTTLVDSSWHYLELQVAGHDVTLWVDGNAVVTGNDANIGSLAYVTVGESSGCRKYSFAVDLVALTTP